MVIWLINHLKPCSFHRQMGALQPAVSMTKNSGQGWIKCFDQNAIKWLPSCWNRMVRVPVYNCCLPCPKAVLSLGLASLKLAKAPGILTVHIYLFPKILRSDNMGLSYLILTTLSYHEGVYMAFDITNPKCKSNIMSILLFTYLFIHLFLY